MSHPVRICLVGFGKWGRNYVRAARESGEAEVTAICTPRPGELADDPEVSGLLRSEHLGHLLTPHVDAVIYAGHPKDAPIVAESVLRSHRPILIEKPAGLSLSDAERIARAEAASNRFVLVGHQHLFSPEIEKLRALERDGYGVPVYLRPQVHMRCAMHCDNAPHSITAAWGGPGPERDYPALWDYGPHAVAMILGLRGRMPHKYEVDDLGGEHLVSMRYDYECGTVTDHAVVSNCWETKKASVQARLERNDGYDFSIYNGFTQDEPPLTRQVRAFARAARAGGTDDWRFGARWAVDVARMLEAKKLA